MKQLAAAVSSVAGAIDACDAALPLVAGVARIVPIPSRPLTRNIGCAGSAGLVKYSAPGRMTQEVSLNTMLSS